MPPSGYVTPTRPAMQRKTTRHAFQAPTSIRSREEAGKNVGLTCQTLYVGIAIRDAPNDTLELGWASHDGTYSVDFSVTFHPRVNSPINSDSGISGTSTPIKGSSSDSNSISNVDMSEYLANEVIAMLKQNEDEHLYKYVGAGINEYAHQLSPQLASRLWQELDIVPLVLKDDTIPERYLNRKSVHTSITDEEADSLARKALMHFGPGHQPRLVVSTYQNFVQVDCEKKAKITLKDDYKKDVNAETTWKATMEYVESLKSRNVRIAFFNSTPQGGGVALMRHALIRFLRTVGVEAEWFVPKPKPEVFFITKRNHNILQDVAPEGACLTSENITTLDDWARQNAERYWIPDGGPLAARKNGGFDVIIVDDPQMPSLVKIAKENDPERPVVFRSHIQVRAELADKEGTRASEVWDWIWGNVKQADLFISHPVRDFVPKSVPPAKVGYLPATTDWLDGLNKKLSNWDLEYYMHEFRTQCFREHMPALAFPDREYIVQIARFDPAKGIPDVLASYAELCRTHLKGRPVADIPQLVIAGHGAIDDTDTTRIYTETIEALDGEYKDIKHDVVVMRVGPTDQTLNALMSSAHVALQLSTREGFEVKVSEALHKGVPIIATKTGGIPLQVENEISGFLVNPGDYKQVAAHLYTLFTDEVLYDHMATYARHHVSDEVGTIGNALSWLYLADALSKGKTLEPNSRWINDMARENLGIEYQPDEPRLPRSKHLDLSGDETTGEKST